MVNPEKIKNMAKPKNTEKNNHLTRDELSTILENQLKILVEKAKITSDVSKFCMLNREIRETIDTINDFIIRDFFQ